MIHLKIQSFGDLQAVFTILYLHNDHKYTSLATACAKGLFFTRLQQQHLRNITVCLLPR